MDEDKIPAGRLESKKKVFNSDKPEWVADCILEERPLVYEGNIYNYLRL